MWLHERLRGVYEECALPHLANTREFASKGGGFNSGDSYSRKTWCNKDENRNIENSSHV